MTRLNTLSAAAIKAMFSSETEEQLITLISIQDPNPSGLDYPIRLADSFTGRLLGGIGNTRTSSAWSKSGTNNSAHRNWGLYRSWYGSNPNSVWGDGGTSEISGTINLNNTGNNVDVVICEIGHIDPDHPEFAVNSDGTGGSRVQNFNWYSLAAAVGDTANIGATYTNSLSTAPIQDIQHAHHVAGIAAGNTQGWAVRSNIYNISTNIVTFQKVFKYIKQGHLIKGSSSRPTIVNCSWNTFYTVNISSISSINYRGTSYTGPFTVNQLQTYGLHSKDNTTVQIPYRDSAIEQDIQDCIDAGVVIVFSAMNTSAKITTDTNDPDYNNTVTVPGIGTIAYSRGGVGAASNVILVGAIRAATNLIGIDGIANFSNRGPRVDIFAPGAYIMSAFKTADPLVYNGFTYPTPVADPRNSSYYMGKLSGTSMAALQVTGVLALMANNYTNNTFNQAFARQVLFSASKLNQIPNSSGGISDVYDLLGATNRYLTVSTDIIGSGSTTSTWSTQELETKEGYTTDTEVIYGVTRVVSGITQEFIFLPMQINLPPEQETGVGSVNITINYVTPQAIILIRKYLIEPVKVTIELVLGSNPNVTEVLFDNFWITSATYNAQSITLQLDMVSLTREPFPNFNFTPTYFPGLF